MARAVAVLVLMALLSVAVEGRDWRFETVRRTKRGYNNGYTGDGAYGRSDDQTASVSREGLNPCSGEGDKSYSGSREQLGYNGDGQQNENRRGHRSFSKASASATATTFNQNHNLAA